MLVGKLRNQADISLNNFSFFLHFPEGVLAPLVLQAFQDLLVLLDYFY